MIPEMHVAGFSKFTRADEWPEEEAHPYGTIASGILVEAFPPGKSVAYAASLFVVETSARSLRNGLSGKTPAKSA